MKKINGEYTFSEAVAKVMEEGERLSVLLGDKLPDDRLLKSYVSLAKRYDKLLEVAERQNKVKTKKNKKNGGGSNQYGSWKLTEENKTLNTETDILTKENENLTKQIIKEKAKNTKLAKADKKYNKLSKENEELNRTVVLREKEIEILIEYIKSLKSRLNNQEDDDKRYPEYHTHDTFKVHNKLAEVVSVLVDKDDDVYGYEVKFEDSDDTFIVYPEEIED